MIQERSDEQVLWERRKFTVSERVPEALEMSDTEILDWMEENYYSMKYLTASQAIVGGHELVYGYQDKVFERTVRGCVKKAAAYDKEANDDIL